MVAGFFFVVVVIIFITHLAPGSVLPDINEASISALLPNPNMSTLTVYTSQGGWETHPECE